MPLALAAFWSYFGAMPVNLSIKNVPEEIVERLRDRAKRRHRSLQGELLAIVEAAVEREGPLTPLEILAKVQGLGLETRSESAEIVRTDRDSR
jgi:plasmid stability protein